MIPVDIHDSLFVATVRPSSGGHGIDILLVIGGTLTIEALVTGRALEKRWRAKRNGAFADWLMAYERNKRAIHHLIMVRHGNGGGTVVIDTA